MSATSGITVSPGLATAFGDAQKSQDVRFLKVSIRNELLEVDQTVPPQGSLENDLDTLSTILEDDVPAYVLVRLDNPPSEWLAISYVPDTAKVRDKMLYASTRANLTKSLGSAPFTDSLFATSKTDVTSAAYKAHRASQNAPKPMTAREKELAEIKATELSSANYESARARVSHIGDKLGLKWTEDAEEAIRGLGESHENKLVVLTIDPATETLVVASQVAVSVDEVGSRLPTSDPCYAFFAWAQGSSTNIVYIYSCPSSSPVKHRMLYSSGMLFLFNQTKNLLEPTPANLVSRKIQTSDPKEINEAFLKSELGASLGGGQSGTAFGGHSATTPPVSEGFARPRGPARKR